MESKLAIRHILMAHDFGQTSEQVLSYALDLAQCLGAKLTVVHAYEVPSYGVPPGAVVSPEMDAEIRRLERSGLDQVAERARRPGVDTSALLRLGPPATEIVSTASDLKVDLIVMGTHGRRGLSRMFMGSVAEKVVRTAPCPVLTMHAPESK
jgi:nucleotide-binding universal stress UspA family protein